MEWGAVSCGGLVEGAVRVVEVREGVVWNGLLGDGASECVVKSEESRRRSIRFVMLFSSDRECV